MAVNLKSGWLIERWMGENFVDQRLNEVEIGVFENRRLGDLVEGADELVGRPALLGHRNVAVNTMLRFTDGTWTGLASTTVGEAMTWPNVGIVKVRALLRLLVDGVRGRFMVMVDHSDPQPNLREAHISGDALSSVIDEAATWAVVRGLPDLASAVLEAVGLPEEESPEWVHELFFRPAIELVSDRRRFDPYACLEDFLEPLDDRDLDILENRLAVEPERVQTLDEIGRRHGVSRERVRQLEVRHLRELAALMSSPNATALSALVQRVASDMGDLCPQDLAADEVLVADDTLTDELIAHLAGPYVLQDGWYRHIDASSPSDRVMEAFDSVAAEGSAEATLLINELVRTGTVQLAAERLVATSEFLRQEGGLLIDQRGHVGDRAVALLRAIGQPIDLEELHGRLNDGTTYSSLRNRIGPDPRLQWVGIGRVGLTEWGDDAWAGVLPAMLEAIDAADKPVLVAALAEGLAANFGVAEASVEIYATTHPLLVESGGFVRRRRSDEPYVVDERIDLARDCRFVDGDWAWRVPVDHDLLRGSGRHIPQPFAAMLDVRPGVERTIQVNGHEVRVGWSHYPQIGSLRVVALEAGAKEGQLAFLSRDGVGGLRFRVIDSGHDDESMLWSALGVQGPPSRQSWLDATAISVGLTAGTESDVVVGRLRERGELDAAAAVERLIERRASKIGSGGGPQGAASAASRDHRGVLEQAMQRTLLAEHLTSPVLPAFVVDSVGKPVMADLWQPWAWRSDEEFDLNWCYRGVPGPQAAVKDRYWAFAHRGHGLNSYAIGLVCRSGPLLVELQTAWGGTYSDPDRATAAANAMVEIWNRWWPLVEGELALVDESEISVTVGFSDVRGPKIDICPGAPEWLARNAHGLFDMLESIEI